jgi:hypothetical protein
MLKLLYAIIARILRTIRTQLKSASSILHSTYQSGASPEKTQRPNSNVHSRAAPYEYKLFLEPKNTSDLIAKSPVISTLQRRALHELFDWAGVQTIPSHALDILDQTGNPAKALEALATSLHCDLELVRRRNRNELSRLATASDLLCTVGLIKDHLRSESLRYFEDVIRTRDFEKLQETSRILSTLAETIIRGTQYTNSNILAPYQTFIEKVSAALKSPEQVSLEVASNFLSTSDAYIQFVECIRQNSESIESSRSRIFDFLSQITDGAEFTLKIEAELEQAARIENILRGDNHLSFARIETLVAQHSAASRTIDALLESVRQQFQREEADRKQRQRENTNNRKEDNAGDRKDRTKENRQGENSRNDQRKSKHNYNSRGSSNSSDSTDSYQDDDPVTAALRFFGFAKGTKPDRQSIRAAWATIMRANHPDIPCPDEERPKRERKTREANNFKEELEKFLRSSE